MRSERAQVAASYVGFVLAGVTLGVSGVLVHAQVVDYRITEAAYGAVFLTSSVGFLAAGLATGWLVARLGTRGSMALGGLLYVATALVTATRPTFAGLVALQLVGGFGTGILESVLNSHLAALPRATVRLGRLHAFFGAGALVGPILAERLVEASAWPRVWLVIGLASVPVMAALVVILPGRDPSAAAAAGPSAGPTARVSVWSVARERAVLLAAAFLIVYVSLELSVGSWGYTYLVEHTGQSARLASAGVSGFWLGLTAGRFVIGPLAERLRWSAAAMSERCLIGVLASGVLVWLAPGPAATGALVLLGFFLGPLFPTAMAIAPQLTSPERAAAAVGLMNGLSVIGGAGGPWLAGALVHGAGVGALAPYLLVLAGVQLVVWRAATARVRVTPVPALGQR
jgi:fucose permease